jgi:hypothetical protein
MKGLLFLSVFLSAAVFFGCSNQSPVSATGSQNSTVAVTAAQWNSYNQSQKDMTVYSVALYYVNSVNDNCKAFVQMVYNSASGGAVTIPGTANNQYSWNPGGSYIVNRNITDITQVGSIDIIQMYIYVSVNKVMTWTPHTAIVVSKDANQMIWLDANWLTNSNKQGIVGTHSVTFAQFRSWTSPSGAGFTVYHVH